MEDVRALKVEEIAAVVNEILLPEEVAACGNAIWRCAMLRSKGKMLVPCDAVGIKRLFQDLAMIIMGGGRRTS